MNISTNHPAIRTKAATIWRERDAIIRADERRVIVNEILDFIEKNERLFVQFPANPLLQLINQIEKKG